MSTHMGRAGGFHDIDTELDSGVLERLPEGLMEHHAFQPHLWRAGDSVAVTTADSRRYEGVAVDVSMVTGNILIRLKPGPGNPGESMDTIAS